MALSFITPRANEGQIVKRAYAAVGHHVIRRTFDQSGMTYEYAVSRLTRYDFGDQYHEAEPPNKRWRVVSREELQQMITEAGED